MEMPLTKERHLSSPGMVVPRRRLNSFASIKSSIASIAVRSSFFKNCTSISPIFTKSPVIMFFKAPPVTPFSNSDSISCTSIPLDILETSAGLMSGKRSVSHELSMRDRDSLVSWSACRSVMGGLILDVKNSSYMKTPGTTTCSVKNSDPFLPQSFARAMRAPLFRRPVQKPKHSNTMETPRHHLPFLTVATESLSQRRSLCVLISAGITSLR